MDAHVVCLQVLTPLPQDVPLCKALYDFVISDKNEKDCLTFHKVNTSLSSLYPQQV